MFPATFGYQAPKPFIKDFTETTKDSTEVKPFKRIRETPIKLIPQQACGYTFPPLTIKLKELTQSLSRCLSSGFYTPEVFLVGDSADEAIGGPKSGRWHLSVNMAGEPDQFCEQLLNFTSEFLGSRIIAQDSSCPLEPPLLKLAYGLKHGVSDDGQGWQYEMGPAITIEITKNVLVDGWHLSCLNRGGWCVAHQQILDLEDDAEAATQKIRERLYTKREGLHGWMHMVQAIGNGFTFDPADWESAQAWATECTGHQLMLEWEKSHEKDVLVNTQDYVQARAQWIQYLNMLCLFQTQPDFCRLISETWLKIMPKATSREAKQLVNLLATDPEFVPTALNWIAGLTFCTLPLDKLWAFPFNTSPHRPRSIAEFSCGDCPRYFRLVSPQEIYNPFILANRFLRAADTVLRPSGQIDPKIFDPLCGVLGLKSFHAAGTAGLVSLLKQMAGIWDSKDFRGLMERHFPAIEPSYIEEFQVSWQRTIERLSGPTEKSADVEEKKGAASPVITKPTPLLPRVALLPTPLPPVIPPARQFLLSIPLLPKPVPKYQIRFLGPSVIVHTEEKRSPILSKPTPPATESVNQVSVNRFKALEIPNESSADEADKDEKSDSLSPLPENRTIRIKRKKKKKPKNSLAATKLLPQRQRAAESKTEFNLADWTSTYTLQDLEKAVATAEKVSVLTDGHATAVLMRMKALCISDPSAPALTIRVRALLSRITNSSLIPVNKQVSELLIPVLNRLIPLADICQAKATPEQFKTTLKIATELLPLCQAVDAANARKIVNLIYQNVLKPTVSTLAFRSELIALQVAVDKSRLYSGENFLRCDHYQKLLLEACKLPMAARPRNMGLWFDQIAKELDVHVYPGRVTNLLIAGPLYTRHLIQKMIVNDVHEVEYFLQNHWGPALITMPAELALPVQANLCHELLYLPMAVGAQLLPSNPWVATFQPRIAPLQPMLPAFCHAFTSAELNKLGCGEGLQAMSSIFVTAIEVSYSWLSDLAGDEKNEYLYESIKAHVDTILQLISDATFIWKSGLSQTSVNELRERLLMTTRNLLLLQDLLDGNDGNATCDDAEDRARKLLEM